MLDPKLTNSAKLDALISYAESILDALNPKVTEGECPEPTQGVSEILEPCPFCGGNPLYIVDPIDGIYITCLRCRVRTPGYFDNRVNQIPNAIVLARKTWNARYVRSNTLAENLEDIHNGQR